MKPILPPDLQRRTTALHARLEAAKRKDGLLSKPAVKLVDSIERLPKP